ncbi:diphthine--ammonia ligase [Kordia sp. YSTF-M3]|uniref:Diphthine--ammonia ligase n=1 Tax=Kordia aestuariivivens TaxID=2759037 RepID=A0ABR7Q882_9FLAO|nr:diphthine--ammonia ligase [Kordia aestuariivivens]MBC8754779.1 diphthine--ammonia ligase [Kordia aestuariivivens]
MKKAYFNWSTGKDSAFALYKILQQKEYSVTQLVTTVNKDYERVSMHGLREELLDIQVERLQIPLQKIYFPAQVSMSDYDEAMRKATKSLVNEGFQYGIFGDIFLEDLRNYREEKLKEISIIGVFPLWKQNTKTLLKEFLSLGFKAITVCVNAKLLDESFVGRIIDESFINDLPSTVDPCGENGEFHTFVFDGPIFSSPIAFSIGEKVLKTYSPSEKDEDSCSSDDSAWDTAFWYCDLIPK